MTSFMRTKSMVFAALLTLDFALPVCASPSTQPAPLPQKMEMQPTNDAPRIPVTMPEASRGQLLYENHCMSCHESVSRIRTLQHVTSLSELHAQVLRWAEYLKLSWDKGDIREVTAHLNNHYYKFQPH